jgi:sugar phosphate isomerase/epimerase
MMRAGLHSWSFQQRFTDDRSFGPRDFIDIAAGMGFHDVEILTGAAGGNPGHLRTEDPAEIAAIVRYAESKGVRVACFSTYNDFAFTPNEEWRLANIAYIKRWLALAGDCGVPNIRMLTGYWVRGRSQVRLQQLVLDGIRECAPHAERAGVNMALENHSTVFLEAEDILWLIEQVGSRRLTTCPDPTNWAHKMVSEEVDKAEREHVFRSTELIAPRMTESHLKVFGITERDEIAGFGSELERLVGIYRAAGYDGVIAFEHIGAGDPLAELPRAKAILERAIARTHSTATAGAKS